MSLRIKLFQSRNHKVNGRWYGRAVSTEEVHTRELARRICANTTLTEADMYAAIKALVEEMRLVLQSGNTVVLDEFGRFHLAISSEMVDNPADYDVRRHVRRLFCTFTPSATRSPIDRHLQRYLVDETELRTT